MGERGPLCRIERLDGQTVLRYTRRLPQPPDEVWRALTEPEHTRWWMPAEMVGDPAADEILALRFWPDLVETKGIDPDAGTATVITWDPPATFEWQWDDYARVRFDLTPGNVGTELGLTVRLSTEDPDVVVDGAGGFHLWMDHLVLLLVDDNATPIADGDAEPLEAEYRPLVEDLGP